MIPELSHILRRFFTGTTVLLLFLFSSGCQSDTNDPGILVDVPTTFNIRMIEYLDSTGNTLNLAVSTIEFQDCLDKTIDFNLSQSYNSLLLSLNDIITPDECRDGFAPARSTVEIDALVPRIYTMDINLKNTVQNNGTLTVMADRYILEMDTENGFQVQNQELIRIPEHTVWGSFAYQDENMASLTDDFLAELAVICPEVSFERGDYGHFYVASDEQVLVPDESPEELSFRRNFVLSCPDVTTELETIIEDFRATYGSDIHIRAYNYRGESW